MNLGRAVIIKLQFEGIHCWPECPIEQVSFLKNPHRHMFYVKACKHVIHNDRDVEIIVLKRNMERWIRDSWGGQFGKMSCEDIAEKLIEQFDLKWCEVLEDNENGATLWQK